MLSGLILALVLGSVRKPQDNIATNPTTTPSVESQYPKALLQSAKTIEPAKATADQEKDLPKSEFSQTPVKPNPVKPNQTVQQPIPQKPIKQNPVVKNPIKQNKLKQNKVTARYFVTTAVFAKYRPNLEVAAVHPSNYGDRFGFDSNGIPLNNPPIIVLHETAYSASSAINFFQTPHDDENVQASYHAIIKLDGTVVYLVPPDKRAFGAGNSVFEGVNGIETIQTNPGLPPSVNNFAYHISLETPPDGRGDNSPADHSGYTEEQYNSLAWLVAQSQVPDERITTHRAVDRSGQRVDPRTFSFDQFFNILHSFRQLKVMNAASYE
jgi:hypothetical protein